MNCSAHILHTIISAGRFERLIKDDAATTVFVVNGDILGYPSALVVKRFNPRGCFEHVRRMLFGSRARRLWSISGELLSRGLSVPRPIAFTEPSLRQRHAFFLSEFMEGTVNLGNLFLDKVSCDREELARQVANAMAAWHLAGAVHGDMKWANILVRRHGDGPPSIFFVDLDQTVLFNAADRRGMIRDLERFYRAGLEFGAADWIDTFFFEAYLAQLPDSLREGIDVRAIRDRASRKWHSKGKTRYEAA